MRRWKVALAAGLTVLGQAGCTQVAQLRGVAGGEISTVRTATNDVLVSQGIAIRVAPVCTFDQTIYTCQGTATDGAAITSTAVVRAELGATTDEWGAYAPADISLVVSVGGNGIYEGTVEGVLRTAGQVTP